MTTRRRGYRILLWAAILYLGASVAIDVAVDGWLPHLRSPYLVDMLAQLRECPPGGPDVVCIGTSRLAMAFSADEIQSELLRSTDVRAVEVFNASAGSQDLVTADFIVEQMLARGRRPALAVVEVAPELLARYDLWLGIHVLPKARQTDITTLTGDVARAWRNYPGIFADHAYPVYRCRRQAWSVLGAELSAHCGVCVGPPETDIYARRGCAARALDAAAVEAQAVATADRFVDTDGAQARDARVASGLRTIRGWLVDYEVGGVTCAALEHLLARCQRHGVRVVLAAPPVASEQRGLYVGAIEAPFRERVHRYEQRYGCRFVDCRGYLPDSCFMDNHHVTVPQGSVRFSRRLAREVLAPELQARYGMDVVHKPLTQ